MCKIYVIDDDESPRRGLVRLLKAAGYPVTGFASGRELLALPDEEINAACLITDARMASMAASDMMRALQLRGLAPVTIMITADHHPDVRAMANELGAAAFFSKPVDGPALLDTIAWLTRNAAKPATANAQSFENKEHLAGAQPQP